MSTTATAHQMPIDYEHAFARAETAVGLLRRLAQAMLSESPNDHLWAGIHDLSHRALLALDEIHTWAVEENHGLADVREKRGTRARARRKLH